LEQPDYDDINGEQVNYFEIGMHDNVLNNYDRRISMKVIKDMNGDYIQMDKFDDHLAMTSYSDMNARISDYRIPSILITESS
jgi:hypothetical protein